MKSEISEDSLFDEIEDTEGFVAADDDIVVVAFRGSSELSDWVTDLKVVLTQAPAPWGVRGRLHKVIMGNRSPSVLSKFKAHWR